MTQIANVFNIFYETHVGHFWASINTLWATFLLGIAFAYILKSWGMASWNRNLVKNRNRFRQQYLDELKVELESVDASVIEKRIEILNLKLADLIEFLQSGNATALEVLDAYRWKALQCQSRFNCITEFIKEASEEAKKLDQTFGGLVEGKPPLFGIPFTVKDNFEVSGYDCSLGLSKELEKPAAEDCSLVEHLKNLGAIPFARTNVPQTLMCYSCSNCVWGKTLNPFDIERTPGGSTGGEAALLASGGVPFGIGSDLGGSIRIPAHFCGLYSLKMTSRRLRSFGIRGGVPGCGRVSLGLGFHGRDVTTIELLCKMFLQQSYFNLVSTTIPMPFSPVDRSSKQPLRVGYLLNDGWITPVPACSRAVQEAKQLLENAGHELVPFEIPRPHEAYSILQKSTIPDNGAYLSRLFEHEQIDPVIKIQHLMMKCPLWLRSLGSLMIGRIWPRLANIFGSYMKSIEDVRITNDEVDKYIEEYTRRWNELRLHALICPAFPFPAVEHEFPQQVFAAIFAVALYNMMDFPAGTVPMTKVSKADVEAMSSYPNNDRIDKLIREGMKGSEGLPVTVQVVCLPYREEMLVHIMGLLEKHFTE